MGSHPVGFARLPKQFVLDLTPYLRATGHDILKVKLVWLGGNKVNFIGLDTSSNANVAVSRLPMRLSVFGGQGDVTSKLTENEGNYLVFGPLQIFRVTFSDTAAPPGLARDYMFVSTGHNIV